MNAFIVFNIVLWVCILLAVWSLYALLRCKPSYSQTMMAGVSFSIVFMCIGYLMEVNAASFDGAANGIVLEFVCSNLAMLCYFLFIADWCEVKLPGWVKTALVVETLVMCAFSFPSPLQYLYFTSTEFITDGIVPTMAVEYGWISYVSAAVQIVLFVAVVVMGVRTLRHHGSRGTQSTLMLFFLSSILPFVVSLLYGVGLFGDYDPAPIAYAISLPLLTYCIVSRRAFDVLPSAFESIVTNMSEIVIVLDEKENLLFANKTATDALSELAVGAPLPSDIWDTLKSGNFPLGARFFQASVIPVGDEGKEQSLVATATDVTDLKYLNNLLEAEQQRVQYDLRLAATIQASALPNVFPPWPTRRDFDIFATMTPAREVGGDFYDFFLVDKNHLGVVIADVSGKGMPAALFMMSAKSYIKDHMVDGEPPARALSMANDQLCEGNEAEMFVTAWAMLIDLTSGNVQFANAGHNPPLLKEHGQEEWRFVKSRPNMVLGDTAGLKYRTNDLRFHEGDVIFLYTDGVTEAMSQTDELYGDDRLKRALDDAASNNPTILLSLVRESLGVFTAGAEQSDDITMLCLRVNILPAYVRVPAGLPSCDVVASFVREWATDHGVSRHTVAQMLVVQDEVLSNIARYAYTGHPERGMAQSELDPAPPEGVVGVGLLGCVAYGEATVELSIDEDRLTIRFIDRGVPFNPLDVGREEHEYADDWDTGGKGISLVMSLMDGCSYEYRDGMNLLTLTKSAGNGG